MKKTAQRTAVVSVLGILASAVVLGAVHAQAPATAPRSQAEYDQQLALTPAQKKQIAGINDRYKPKFMALQAQFQAIQKQGMALSMARGKDMDALLTPTQRVKAKQIAAAMQSQREQMGRGGMPGGGGPPPMVPKH